MKRLQTCKKVNRNNNTFNHLSRKATRVNSVSPEILVGQIWLQDESTAVEIIELNSSNEFDPLTDNARDNHLDHAWSYAHNERFLQREDNCSVNKKARERRRMNQENNFFSTRTNTSTDTNNNFINSNYFSDITGNDIDDNKLKNHQVNCFTIINKHFINSDTSSDEEYGNVEIITSNDEILEATHLDARKKAFDEEIITYDPDSDKETRTVWIYSFKNKHLLTEDDYELTNMAASDTASGSTSCSVSEETDEEKTKDKCTNVRRLGSPIPPTYIPRLNLSLGQTLSTVTEVSEPNKNSSNRSYKSPKNRFQKSKNSWFINDSEVFDGARSVRKLEKSTNIVNWMALSPREKRRRSLEQGDKWEGSLLKLETTPTKELLDFSQQLTDESFEQNKAIRLQVDVDVHVCINEKTPEKRSLGTPNSTDVIVKRNTEDISPIHKIIYPAVDLKGRGDHDMKFEQTQQILCVTKPNSHMNITGFIEDPPLKFDKEAWAREETEEKETASYDYLTNKLESAIGKENGADETWVRNNKPFLRPAEWSEYLPITATPLSIRVSIDSTARERRPWFKRIMNCIKCCK